MPPGKSITITGAVISGQRVRIEGYYSASGDWRPLAVNASGELPISVTTTATAEISGQAVWVSSGEVIARVSGQPVSISGQPVDVTITQMAITSGEVHITSGEVSIETPSIVRVGHIITVPSTSGGIELSSGEVKAVVIKSLSRNSGDIYIGGNTLESYPHSGYGLLLEPGESVNLDISNLNIIHIFAVVSGDKVSYMGIH